MAKNKSKILFNLGKSGQAFLLSIFIILAFSVLSMVCLAILTNQSQLDVELVNSFQSFWLAEAARMYAYEYIFPWKTAFSPGKFSIYFDNSVTTQTQKTSTLTFQGNAGESRRRLRIDYDALANVPQVFKDYVFTWRTKPSNFEPELHPSDYTITGDVYAGGTIELDKAGLTAGPNFLGDIYARGSVTALSHSNAQVSGTVYYTGSFDNQTGNPIDSERLLSTDPRMALPIAPTINTAYYNREISTTPRISGPVNWNNKNLERKNWYVNGDVVLNGGTTGGPAVIVANGGKIQNFGKIYDKITLIATENIGLSEDGGFLHDVGSSNGGCLVYSRKNVGTVAVGGNFDNFRFYGSILASVGSINYGVNMLGLLSSYVHQGIFYSGGWFQRLGINSRGAVFSARGTYLPTPKNYLSGSITHDTSKFPLSVKGLYRIAGTWQELFD